MERLKLSSQYRRKRLHCSVSSRFFFYENNRIFPLGTYGRPNPYSVCCWVSRFVNRVPNEISILYGRCRIPSGLAGVYVYI